MAVWRSNLLTKEPFSPSGRSLSVGTILQAAMTVHIPVSETTACLYQTNSLPKCVELHVMNTKPGFFERVGKIQL